VGGREWGVGSGEWGAYKAQSPVANHRLPITSYPPKLQSSDLPVLDKIALLILTWSDAKGAFEGAV